MEQDPYWTDDILLGEVCLPQETALVRLRLHESQETYHGRNVAELVPLRQPTAPAPMSTPSPTCWSRRSR